MTVMVPKSRNIVYNSDRMTLSGHVGIAQVRAEVRPYIGLEQEQEGVSVVYKSVYPKWKSSVVWHLHRHYVTGQ